MSDNRIPRVWKVLTDSEVKLIGEAIALLTKLAIDTKDKNQCIRRAMMD